MKSGLICFFVVVILSGFTIACSVDKSNDSSDAGNDTAEDGGDTEDDTETSLAGLDCSFSLVTDPYVIRAKSGGHVAFPDVTGLSDGRILLVYREAAAHGVDPTGMITGQIGEPDGLSFGEPFTVHDEPDVDDRDPSVSSLANGDLVLNYFQYVYQATASDGDLGVHQIFFGSSSDDAETWGDFSMVPSNGSMSYAGAYIGDQSLWVDFEDNEILVTACSNDVVEVGDELIVQSYGGNSWVSSNPSAPKSYVSFFRSSDHGQSWFEQHIKPEEAQDTWLQEPALLIVDEERWIIHLRTAEGSSPGNPGTMWQTISTDGGETFGEYTKFDFVGHAPFLYRLSNGVLVSAFRWLNDTFTSTNVNFMYSMDQGETWSEMISVLGPQVVEVGYPSIIELPENRMLIIYYVGGTSIQGAIYSFELVSDS